MFAPYVSYPSGGQQPFGIVSGDFDGDNHLDLAVPNEAGGSVAILYGAANGTFASGAVVGNFLNPWAITRCDVNGDMRLDIVTANAGGTGTAGVLLNSGGRMFNATTYPAFASPIGIACGNLNGDTRPDLVVAATQNGMTQVVGVLLADASGSFGAPAPFSTGGTAENVAMADVNGDGHNDVVAANVPEGTVAVLLGDGQGGLGAAKTFPVPSPVFVTIVDLDGDGNLDIVSASSNDGSVSVLLGKPSSPTLFGPAMTYPAGNNPSGVVAGDFDGDGVLDLAVSDADYSAPAGAIAWLRGTGGGAVAAPVTFPVGPRPTGLVAGDFNGDGKLDIACSLQSDNAVGVLLNRR
jgi:hypothetical protein